jgi:outer membrane protein assembly factor BamB
MIVPWVGFRYAHGGNKKVTMRTTCLLLTFLLPAALPAADENWPEFRGPSGQGHSGARGLPLTWSQKENIRWKTAIHDRGWSSPVVWEDQIWVTTATEDGKRMYAVGVDRKTGKIVHDIPVFETASPEHISTVNSYASPTPAIEAGRVYAHYGTYGTACLDTRTGQVLWSRRDLNCDHHEGPGSSPILYGDLLIVHVDGRDVQYVIALDKTSGKTRWKTDRSVDYKPFPANTRKGFCTPLVISWEGKPQLISPGAKAVMGYDPATGEELWKARYDGWSMVPRPVFGGSLVYFVTDYERPELWAVRPGGRGEKTDPRVAWKITKGMPAQPSFLLVDGLLYAVNDNGIIHCIEAATGTIVWKDRIEGNYAASPIHADGRMYFTSDEARTTVVQPGREFKVLATNELDEPLKASPAVAGKSIILRTRSNLYCIEAPEKS